MAKPVWRVTPVVRLGSSPAFRHRSDGPLEVGPHPLLVAPRFVRSAHRGANPPIPGQPGPVPLAYAPPPVGRRGRRRAQLHVVEQEERAVSRLHRLVDPYRVLPGLQPGTHHHAPVASVRPRGRGAGRRPPAGEDGGAVGVAFGERPVRLVLDPRPVIDAHPDQRVDGRPVPGLAQVEVVRAPLASKRIGERPEAVRGMPPVVNTDGVGGVGESLHEIGRWSPAKGTIARGYRAAVVSPTATDTGRRRCR